MLDMPLEAAQDGQKDRHEVAVVEAPTPAPTAPGALLSAIVELARDKRLDKELLAFLMDRQERAEDRQAERDFNEAMAACQAEIQPVARSAENKQTKSFYAKLEAVDEAIRPIYTAHGFALQFDHQQCADGKNIEIVCFVSRGGHTVRRSMFAPPDTMGPQGTPNKTVLHGIGSTNTFLRRYLTCNVFNVVLKNMDDDGNRGGSPPINKEQLAELQKLMQDNGFEKEQTDAFVDWLGVKMLPDLPAHLFDKAKNSLLARKAKKAQGAQP